MTPLVLDAAARPGLAYQHAFDWVAVQLHAASGPALCLTMHSFAVAEILRRVPGIPITGAPADGEAIATALGVPWSEPREPARASLASVAWVEPLAQDLARLDEVRGWLRPGGQLYVVVGGRLSRFLAERRTSSAGPYLDERDTARALVASGYRRVGRLGLHGPQAIAWHLLGRAASRLGRPHWQDRFHVAMRRDFLTRRGPAALVCLTAEVAA